MTLSQVGGDTTVDAGPEAAPTEAAADPRTTDTIEIDAWQVEYREGLTGEAGSDDDGHLVLACTGAGEAVLNAPEPLSPPAGAGAVQLTIEYPGVAEPGQLGEVFLLLSGGQEVSLGPLDFAGTHILRALLPGGASIAGLSARGLFLPDTAEVVIKGLRFETRATGALAADPAGPYGSGQSMVPASDEEVTNSVRKDGISYVLEARSLSAVVRYVYTPIEGNLSDIEVEINNSDAIKLSEDGGISVFMDGKVWSPADEEIERHFVSCEQVGDALEARWQFRHGSELADFLYRLRIDGKSLVVDIEGAGGKAAGVELGYVSGAVHPRLIKVPYLTLGDDQPAVLATSGVFISSLLDWNVSAAAALHAVPARQDQVMHMNGGSTYLPASDGARPPLHERWVLTVSRRFEEVLPVLPAAENHEPQALSPELVWCKLPEMAAGEEAYIEAYERMRVFRQVGMKDLLVLHPESTWSDGSGGAPALDTEGADAKGGDDAFREYLDALRDLGYDYGLHASLRSITPYDRAWATDRVALDEHGEFAATGPGRYQLKPSAAPELAAASVDRLIDDYGASAVYVGDLAAEPPWARIDCDARLDHPASFAATLHAEQAALASMAANGRVPVIADGGSHWLYPDLASGYVARLRGRVPADQPLLVDFSLRHLRGRALNGGVGLPEEFAGQEIPEDDRHGRSDWLDRYLAATLAFGHAALLPDLEEWGLPAVAKTYFLMRRLQPLYLQAELESVHYQRGGNLLETTEALVAGAHELSQLRLVYGNGLQIHVNGSRDEDWSVEIDEDTVFRLPPASFLARGPGDLLVYSADLGAGRVDYAACDDYLYCDTRGQRQTVGPLTVNGAALLTHEDWVIDVFPLDTTEPIEVNAAEIWKGRRMPPLRVLAYRDELEEPEALSASASDGVVSIRPAEDVYRYRITLPEWMVEPGK